MKPLKPNEKIDVTKILKDLDRYRPKRKGWTWRKPVENQQMGPFELKDTSESLKQSVPLPYGGKTVSCSTNGEHFLAE